jgi:release factor glutamine methyltransferase
MRPAQVVRRAADYLDRHGVESPLPTAEHLLESVLGTDRAGVYSRAEPLRGDEARAFGRALCRRCAGEPTQLLVGETSFRHLSLLVRPGVFVPRPETEVVVGVALEALEGSREPVVVDVGTGTGAIGLSIKHERPDAVVWAVDVSAAALELARLNGDRAGLGIEIRRGDLLAGLEVGLAGSVDLVVSNPPYVEPEEYAALPREVRADPVGSLVAGVGIYAELFDQAARGWLAPGGRAVVEIGERQAEAVADAARVAGAASVSVRRDLTGRDRVVLAAWP